MCHLNDLERLHGPEGPICWADLRTCSYRLSNSDRFRHDNPSKEEALFPGQESGKHPPPGLEGLNLGALNLSGTLRMSNPFEPGDECLRPICLR